MILTVTLNPLIERRITYPSVNSGKENRNGKEILQAGGKGINVSRQLNHFNLDNVALTFTGGNNGKVFKEQLFKENIKNTSIRTKEETRSCTVIIDEKEKSVSSFFTENKNISKEEADEFKEKLGRMIQNCEIVIFAGSSPCKEADSIIPFGINIANKYDKISICDTYGAHLEECIKSAPTILHNNIQEIEASLNKKIETEGEKINLLKHFYSSGIKQSFITDGANDFYASNFDFHFKIENPKIKTVDSTGSGDAFTAGIIYGLHNDLTFEEYIILASSLGAVNASKYDVCNVLLNEIEDVKKEVKINPVGKKIRTVDVTPR